MSSVADDWTPIHDRSGVDGCYLAVGTSGNQFKNGPIAREIMARLIDAVEGGHDHDADPIGMTCHHTGLDLDRGQLSRRREPAATGGNVWGTSRAADAQRWRRGSFLHGSVAESCHAPACSRRSVGDSHA